ncbi:MAG: hypothetical protein IT182_19555 [Acidobacteria bacterium]|nr:hypothetical protein [Acidobacteriota bacterium]
MPGQLPSTRVDAAYDYPPDLARFALDRWSTPPPAAPQAPVPELATLTHFLSACYQASLLREEERPVTFRAILASPDQFPAGGVAPAGLRRLAFCDACPLDANQLRRLAVAADMHRMLIGAHQDGDGSLRIWGLVNSGPRWLRDVQGGRRAGAPLPAVPVAHVEAPGVVSVYRGPELVARLQGGRISGSRADAFASTWLPDRFADLRAEMEVRHFRAREASAVHWAPIASNLSHAISQRMMKRAIALLRHARHGGTIVFVPMETAQDLCAADPFIDLKYGFEDVPRQGSFPDLVVSILNRLAALHGDGPRPNDPVGWAEFETTPDDELATLDEALFEMAHLIAGLASTDGAVVLNKQHDILGFGGMISGRLPAVRRVDRALDLDGNAVAEEGTENVGARHRSAYRLAGALPGAIVIVISQDGGVRFVAQKDGRVTYWEQE